MGTTCNTYNIYRNLKLYKMDNKIEILQNKIFDLEFELKHLQKILKEYQDICKKKDKTLDFFIKIVKI